MLDRFSWTCKVLVALRKKYNKEKHLPHNSEQKGEAGTPTVSLLDHYLWSSQLQNHKDKVEFPNTGAGRVSLDVYIYKGKKTQNSQISESTGEKRESEAVNPSGGWARNWSPGWV